MKAINKRPKRKRGVRGLGTIVYRPEKGAKPWEIRIRYTHPTTKKRVTKAKFYATEAEAHTARPMLATKYAPGALDRMEDVTLAAYLAVWLGAKKRKWAPGTYRTQENYVRLHILGENSRLGAIELRALTEGDVTHFLNEMQDRNVGAPTRAAVLTTLKSALGDAEDRYTTTNAAKFVEAPKVEKSQKEVLTIAQARRLLEVSDQQPMGSLIRFMLDTGCRLSEAFALTWDDVRENHVIISTSLAKNHDGEMYRGPTKTGDTRHIILEPDTMRALKRLDRTKKTWQNVVWSDGSDKPLNKDTFRKRIAVPMFKAAKLPSGFTLHGLRHTAATLQFQNGADIATVKARGGWTTDRILLGIYAHATTEGQRKLVDTMAEAKQDPKNFEVVTYLGRAVTGEDGKPVKVPRKSKS